MRNCGQSQTEDPEREPSDNTLYFPVWLDGDGWSVQLALVNTSATTDASATVNIYRQDGSSVRNLFTSQSGIDIPPLGGRVMKSRGTGSIRRGWIEIEPDSDSVSGLLTYRDEESGIEVGVESVELGTHFALFIEESSDIGTGMAVFKSDEDTVVELRVRDESGDDPWDGGFVTWTSFTQEALTIPEWFEPVPDDQKEFLSDFRGVLFLRMEDGSEFAHLGLRFGKKIRVSVSRSGHCYRSR